MNVFFEFYKIVQQLQKEGVRYAVVGGVAMAFHSYARFTRDVDILSTEDQLGSIRKILESEGYTYSAKPWAFNNQGITLHRFIKILDEDEMVIDLLLANTPRHSDIIDHALEAYSKHAGTVRVATKEDLIWLKSQRGSAIDQVDIEKLRGDE